MGEEPMVIVDLRREFRGDQFVTFWRPDCCGYAYPLSWAGRYSQEEVVRRGDYLTSRRYRNERVFDRWAVPLRVAERLAVAPPSGRIDGDAGPVIRNNEKNRRALRRARFVPPPPQTARTREME